MAIRFPWESEQLMGIKCIKSTNGAASLVVSFQQGRANLRLQDALAFLGNSSILSTLCVWITMSHEWLISP